MKSIVLACLLLCLGCGITEPKAPVVETWESNFVIYTSWSTKQLDTGLYQSRVYVYLTKVTDAPIDSVWLEVKILQNADNLPFEQETIKVFVEPNTGSGVWEYGYGKIIEVDTTPRPYLEVYDTYYGVRWHEVAL